MKEISRNETKGGLVRIVSKGDEIKFCPACKSSRVIKTSSTRKICKNCNSVFNRFEFKVELDYGNRRSCPYCGYSKCIKHGSLRLRCSKCLHIFAEFEKDKEQVHITIPREIIDA